MTAQTSVRAKRGPYSSPRQQQRQRRILETARREITSVGYDALTMQQLAKASEVSTKTLYNLFGSKDELLLAAVADLLGNLEQQPAVLAAAPGLATLRAFTEAVFDQVEETPRYAEVMAKSLFQAEPGHRLVEILLGNTLRVTAASLDSAKEGGELLAGTDTEALSQRLAAQQWGLILLWSKGLLELRELKSQALQGQVDALVPLATEPGRQRLLATA
jgi:AcrR family transcriptional regulator